MIEFDRNACVNLAAAVGREWLETNGLGGYASSTIAGLHTRRYHGLLIAATKPPVGRMLLLSKLEETLIIGGRRFELSANQYPGGVVHPRGHEWQTSFRLDPFPVFTYRVEGVEVEKSVFMVHGENTTCVRYVVRGAGDDSPAAAHLPPVLFELRPLIAFRDHHGIARENGDLNPHVTSEAGHVALTPYAGMPTLHLAHDAGEVEKVGWWYRNLEYGEERARGFDFTEDLFSPCVLRFDLRGRSDITLIASTERRDVNEFRRYRRGELARREETAARAASDNEFVRALVRAADHYVVARGHFQTIIAGYHWFSDWGRDTMIALPGLTLAAGRFEVAKGILREFARAADRGMLPNRFPDAGESPDYNTVDATLWFFEAVRALVAYTNDYDFVRAELYPVLRDIVAWHERGTRYGIRVAADGLLDSGAEGVQLTWMDAKVGDWVVTPRRGRPVEIQALWYNALRVMEAVAGEIGLKADAGKYGGMAEKARESFNRSFWNEDAACLYDVVDGDARDGSIRPNQIIAVSLRHSMLSPEKARQVVAVVARELLTPHGLRTLARGDAHYRGRYEGGPVSRDGSYHQGTVWAWLMGPFITAYVKVSDDKSESRRRAVAWLEPFRAHLAEAGLGHVSEIFDGDAPHRPGGCVAQAWSVGELLRAAVEDVFVSGR